MQTQIGDSKPKEVTLVSRSAEGEKAEPSSSQKGGVLKRVIRNLIMLLILGPLTISCRGLGPAGPLIADIAATAIVTALVVAAWYSVANPIVVYPSPGVYRGYYRLPPGSRIYVLAYSADGYWVQIQTPDGRVGWVPRDQLQDVHPLG